MPDHITTARTDSYRTLGALYDGSGTAFRIWAPDARRIDLVLDANGSQDVRALAAGECGYWHGRFADVAPGARYRFRMDGDEARTFPDPAARFQPDGVHGASAVVDPRGFVWTDATWTPPPLPQLTIYELHVGAFSPEGTFRGVTARLPELVALGVTAIELMPVADFPGGRNWGYDGVALFAPARCYGSPDDLRALVDTAHRLGLAVLLDVVYNHLGPDGAYANAFSGYYFTDRHSSPWGLGVNLDGPQSGPVRRFFIENALHWVNEYHLDGLRLDATHELRDDGDRHFLEELTTTLREHAERPVVVTAEDHRNLARLLAPAGDGGFGIDAVWADDFHHQVRVHAAGDREGYFADFSGSIDDIARTLQDGWFFSGQPSAVQGKPRGTDARSAGIEQFVICIQNHDQIGNRADGARLHHQIPPESYRALSALLLLVPETPLLFMGQDWAASSPFLFFTDHHAELGRLVTEGRREEFRSFAAFADPARRAAIPDPQAEETFTRSRLSWDERSRQPHAGTQRLYQRLLDLRRREEAFATRTRERCVVRPLDDHTIAVCHLDAPLLIVARLSGGPGGVRLDVTGTAAAIVSTEDADVVDDGEPIGVSDLRSDDPANGIEIRFARPGAVVMRAAFRNGSEHL